MKKGSDLHMNPDNPFRTSINPGGPRGPRGLGSRRRRLSPCGTYGAYQRHLRLDEPACRPCTDAARDYQRARAAARRATAAPTEPRIDERTGT